uniref:Zinc finger protein ush n=1 Tax=Cacopsylla melanoneura TaxID=428564 RepID=A0A8D8YV06_9HEMI
MSRRKQSNPKPLKGEEDEEWSKNVSNETDGTKEDHMLHSDEKTASPEPQQPPQVKNELTDNETSNGGYQSEDEQARRSAPSEGTRTDSGSEPRSPDVPKVRLNTNLATDPARNSPSVKSASPSQSPTGSVRSNSEGKVSVKAEPIVSPSSSIIPSPAELEYLASLPPTLQSAIASGRLFFPGNVDPRKKLDIPEVRQGPVYTCVPCGIRFSSASTLEAHQTYYCTHRVQKSKDGADSDPEESSTPKPPLTPTGEDPPLSSGDGTRSPRIGKAHRCPHCSYSADKKVSLNRHMRMHSASPPTLATTPGPIPQNSNSSDMESESSRHLVDRYCTDCDIRFSSLKTFRAHKMHYCSTRHVIKNVIGKPPSAPPSPNDAKLSPSSSGPPEPQPFLALPTNPILIVPYSLFQNASILSGPVTMGLPSQDMACLLMPDGTLQPMAHGILNSNNSGPGNNKQRTVTPGLASQQTQKEVVQNNEPQPTNISNKPSSNNGHHLIKSSNMRNGTPGPLDLTTHRPDVESGDMCEDEKENRRSVDNQSVETEDIVCAPSIPLLLSTSSTCSSPSPSPAPISPCSNSSQRREGQSNSSSPRSGASPPARLRRPHNGMKAKDMDVKRRRIDSNSISQPGFSPVGFDVPNLFLAAVAAQHDLKSDLPFPPELLPHLAASVSPRLNVPKNAKLPPGLLPAGLQGLLPRGGADINPASLLPMLNPELLRISAELPTASLASPLVVKQGVSKCQECNIVFCKLENYLAHKKHYCSARQNSEASAKEEIQPPTPQLKTSPSPPSPTTSVSPKPTTPLLQFICNACGVKFMTYDSLSAHQTYYCNKKPIVSSASSVTSQDGSEKSNRKSPKFKQELPGVGWKCPCCNVISTSTCAAQKHMESHKNVKAFLCSICSYKGNTLRGMRTHIRMHFETRSADVVEDNFITCVIDDAAGINNNNEGTDLSKQGSRSENFNNNDIEMSPESAHNVNGIVRKNNFPDVTIQDDHLENEIKKEIIDPEEYIDVDEDSNSHVDNNNYCNASSSPNLENNTLDLTRGNSESKMKCELDITRIQNEVSVKKENLENEITRVESAETDEESRYCTTCDITFNYASSLIAHKKFYCPKVKV